MTREVSLSSLHLDHPLWINPRTFTGLSDKDIGELAEDIKARGILVPPMVQRITANGSTIDLVIDGQRRVRAALEAFSKNHKIEVIDRTDKPIEFSWEESDKAMLDALAMGQKREGLSSFELSEVAERMRSRDRTLDDIAAAIGRSPSWVSKMLKARTHASPKLMLAWRKGQVTDEQFKDLANVDQSKQGDHVKTTIEARESGDKAEARQTVKELAEKFKRDEKQAKKPDSAPNGKSVTTPANGGHQAEMWGPPPPVKKTAVTPRFALEELVQLADKRAPTHDYVKGIMDGVRYALADLDPNEFGKPWRAYIERVGGTGAKKAKKAKAPKKSKQVTWDAKAKREKKGKAKARKSGKAKR